MDEESQYKAHPLFTEKETLFQDAPYLKEDAPLGREDAARAGSRRYSSDTDSKYAEKPPPSHHGNESQPLPPRQDELYQASETIPKAGVEAQPPLAEEPYSSSRNPRNKRGRDKKNNDGRLNKPNRNRQRKESSPKHSKSSRERKSRSTVPSRLSSRDELSENGEPLVLGDLPSFKLFDDIEALETLATQLAGYVGPPVDFDTIYRCSLKELVQEAKTFGIESASAPQRNELIRAILSAAAATQRPIHVTGTLEILEAGYGLLTYQQDSYALSPQSAFVSAALIQRYGLKRGHILKAQIHPQREGSSCPFAVKLLKVMDRPLDEISQIPPFTERIPYYPLERLRLETDGETSWDNLSMRIVDLLTPIGYGQRGLIVAPPRTGKTILLQGIANSIQTNNPQSHLIVVLIDERPEEVTDFRRQVKGEVISSTFDQSAESHCHAAEMVIEKARRMVETGEDVVILLDSITRLARAYNTLSPNSGKILSGGVEAGALQKPKRFFGSARNIEDGGSLTILATALIDTGSRMDEVIFEEFKGTGNMELHLDRTLSEKRIFPALSFEKSGTRKEELLYHPDEMGKIYSLRRAMKGVPSQEAMEMLIQRVKKTSTNVEFLMSLSR